MSSPGVDNKSSIIERMPEELFEDNKTGQIDGKPVVKANKQISKGWFILAIVIGSLVVVGVGGFGTVGLIQSYGLNLPQWLQ